MCKQIKYSVVRCFMKTVGQLSDGVRLCYQEGLTAGKMLDYIYKNEPSGKFFIGKLIDQRFLEDPGWQAVRTRRKNLEKLMTDAIASLRSQKKSVSLMDIASGPGAYILAVLKAVGENDVFARCRDFESRWVAEGEKAAQKAGLKNVRFEQGDAFSRTEIIALKPQPNLCVASGFYDWFNDDEKIKLSIRIVHEALEHGGYFVLSIQSAHPNLEFTEQVFTDFNKKPLRMAMRSKETMAAFLKEAGFIVEETLTDGQGYYAVLKARKA